jgi:hypothetical protein
VWRTRRYREHVQRGLSQFGCKRSVRGACR